MSKTLFAVFLLFGQYLMPAPNDEPIRSFDKHFVLIYRQWTQCNISHGDSIYTEGCWQYEKKDFDNATDATAELTSDGATGGDNKYPRYRIGKSGDMWQREFVGIYELKRIVGPDDVRLTEGDKVQSHTVEQKDHWFKWDVKSPSK